MRKVGIGRLLKYYIQSGFKWRLAVFAYMSDVEDVELFSPPTGKRHNIPEDVFKRICMIANMKAKKKPQDDPEWEFYTDYENRVFWGVVRYKIFGKIR